MSEYRRDERSASSVWQKHEAGRHLVVAEALLRGYHARTVGRFSLVEVNGRSAEVHVGTTGAWQIGDLDKFVAGATERVVFVDPSETVPVFFILEGDQFRTDARREHEAWLERVGGVRPRTPESKHSLIKRKLVQRGQDRWSLFD